MFFPKKKKEEDKVISCDFTYEGKSLMDMTEDELKKGYAYQQEIFDGCWNWLIFDRGIIKMTDGATSTIEIILDSPVYDGSLSWGGGCITSEMKEVCPHCEDRSCNFDCMDALEWASDRDIDIQNYNNEELKGNRNFNYGCDAIEVMVLTHAIAGLNVDNEMYHSGIRAALEGLANNT